MDKIFPVEVGRDSQYDFTDTLKSALIHNWPDAYAQVQWGMSQMSANAGIAYTHAMLVVGLGDKDDNSGKTRRICCVRVPYDSWFVEQLKCGAAVVSGFLSTVREIQEAAPPPPMGGERRKCASFVKVMLVSVSFA